MYYVYVLQSKKNLYLYKGFTKDLKKRIEEHEKGLNESTKNNRPWKLIYCEIFINKNDAIAREKYLKSGWGRTYLKRILKNYLNNKQKK